MTRWRLAALLLLGLFALPLAWPLGELAATPGAWDAWPDPGRLLGLAGNTALLTGGTLALALPLGVAGAVLLFRTDLPCRGALHFLTVCSLFVPLPVLTSAWQAALGAGGLLPVALWVDSGAGPWATGMLPAVWVHAIAALPWVVLIVGQGLRSVEWELEEAALLSAPPLRVLRAVTLPRAGAAVAAAGIWVALLTANEITVAYFMQVNTFAEEIYLQLGRGGPDAAARAIAAAVPAVVLTWAALLAVAPWLGAALAAVPPSLAARPLLRLGGWRWASLMVVLTGGAALTGLPVASLVWKAGQHGSPLAWSAGAAADRVLLSWHLHGQVIAQSLGWAALAGMTASGGALLLGWAGLDSPRVQAIALAVLAAAWALPGPIVGLGLKGVIMAVVLAEPGHVLAGILYDGPSRVPILWAHLLRFLPAAAALVWPALRTAPPALREAARVDGATPGQELVRVVAPHALPACLAAGLAVSALALGEVSASKLVGTPGSDTFTQVVFDRMHYGVEAEVAGLCLALLALVLLAGAEVGLRSLALRRSLR